MKVLSQAEMDVLYENVPQMDMHKKAPKKVLDYDFRHPNLLSKEQVVLLEKIHQGIVKNISAFLSDQLRMIVELNVLDVNQRLYSDYKTSIGTPAAIYIGDIEQTETQIILDVDPQFGIFIVERLLGGEGTKSKTVRHLSLIEQRLFTKIVEKISREIEENWKPIEKIKCEFARYEEDPESVQIVSASEPVVVVALDIKYQKQSSLLNICYPYQWIANILSHIELFNKPTYNIKRATDSEQVLLEKSIKNTSLDLHAVLGEKLVTVDDFIQLKCGDVIPLDTATNDKIQIKANEYRLYQAYVGTHGKNYAIRISSIVKGAQENEH